ncbi:DUF4426 domain-containing protein [Agarivorans sp. QJM3NY_29]|uniref:DUF4426 domain-containing protein n=1 Tax=unclassified Agarivorans TaxID=2636026 RepID=UPI003D7E4568
MRKYLLFSFVSSLLLFAFPSQAEQKVLLGDYEVHYMALNSTFIPAEVAKVYQLERSRYKGLINITVLDAKAKGKPALAVKISGTAQNLIGNQNQLEFQEVREGDSVYYLAQLRFSNEETFRFEILIGEGPKQQRLKFNHKFYVE